MSELPSLPSPDERSPIAADFLARWQARLLLAQRKSGLQGACGIRSDLELAPHQARTLLEVLSAPRVRHVLADEVGMGKTIEALMVFSALRAAEPRLWTTVIVPGHLAYQWLGEVYLRAHRVFAIATRGREDALSESQDVLLDREWLTANEDARRGLREAFGGRADRGRPRLLVVDEAHRLAPDVYALVQELAASVEHVLLLTATPVELSQRAGSSDQLRYQDLLRILDPGLTEEGFEELVTREAAVLETFARSEAQAEEKDLLAARGLAAWRVLRHRRADAPRIFRKRVFAEHRVRPRDGYLEALEEARQALNMWAAGAAPDAASPISHSRFRWEASISAERAVAALGDAPELAAAREKLGAFVDADPKLGKLAGLIAAAWREDRKAGKKTLRKFLVFVSHRSTLERVARGLEDALAADVAVFHEGLDNALRPDGDPPPRLQQLLDFRNKPATAILVCEDLAAEGHNLHSACHTVVLYDLPENPNTTEQRIGRVDRLGQSRDVAVHALVLEGTRAVEQLARQAALGVFQHSIGPLAPSEEEALTQWGAGGPEPQATAPHAAVIAGGPEPQATAPHAALIALGARRDLTSPLRAYRNRRSEDLDQRIRVSLEAPEGWVFRASSRFQEWYGEAHLAQQCLGSLLTRAISRAFDLKAEKNENPPPRVRESLRFRLARGDAPIPGYRDTWGTFDRDEALEQDHLQFFASGHPFVEDAIGRATARGHGERQALRFRIPGRGPRFGVLCHFVWDPASVHETDFGRRLASVALPTLSVPAVVSATPDRKVSIEAGPPEEGSLLRALLQALVELDPNECESLLEDPFTAELAEPWLARAREAALENARAWLASFPDAFGRRALARARSEVERDLSLPGRAECLAAIEAVSALAGAEKALVLDAVATFEVR